MSKELWDSCLQQEIPYEMLDLANHPTPTDLEKRLGKELTEAFLQQCTPFEKVLFGTDKPLKGPGNKKMWIDPKDRADGNKLSITEVPLKTDCLQALTHRGILEIGEQVEKMLAERNAKDIESAVKEAMDVARFEADMRIKFHVEQERQRLNEEWQRHYDELIKSHEEEKESLVKVFEDSRKVFCEYVARKCQDEINIHVNQAIEKTKQELADDCTKRVDEELSAQHAILEEAMEKTLKNLEANDRDKMNELCNQCLNAMDVHSNLMMCRQITELMHLMSTERQHWQMKLNDLKEKDEMRIQALEDKINSLIHVDSPTEHQSNQSFIVALWKKFFKSLKSIDVSDLNEGETEIFNELQRIQCELIENHDDNTSRVFVVNDECKEDEQKFSTEVSIDDWIDKKIDCTNLGSTVDVEWTKEGAPERMKIDDKFMASVFQKMAKNEDPQISSQSSILTKTASSIIKAAKDVKEMGYKKVEGEVVEILKRLCIQLQVDMVPLPNSGNLSRKDSLHLMERKTISIVADPSKNEGGSNMLSVVDSLELLSQRVSLEENVSPIDTEETKNFYKKMTPNDWSELKALQDMLPIHPKRHSSIQFDDTCQNSVDSKMKYSILKKPSTQKNDTQTVENALTPIHEKCHETMNNMRLKSILKLLCHENVAEADKSTSSLGSGDE